jgi:hypothetical protein
MTHQRDPHHDWSPDQLGPPLPLAVSCGFQHKDPSSGTLLGASTSLPLTFEPQGGIVLRDPTLSIPAPLASPLGPTPPAPILLAPPSAFDTAAAPTALDVPALQAKPIIMKSTFKWAPTTESIAAHADDKIAVHFVSVHPKFQGAITIIFTQEEQHLHHNLSTCSLLSKVFPSLSSRNWLYLFLQPMPLIPAHCTLSLVLAFDIISSVVLLPTGPSYRGLWALSLVLFFLSIH